MSIDTPSPERVWKHFFDLCAIPRPSHHEQKASAHAAAWGRSRGFEVVSDSLGNVIVRKPAAKGREAVRGVAMQAHLDMVPQAASGSKHDFTRDPVVPRRDPADPDWVVASGTTLGADNGMGMAMIMAAMEEDGLAHGPLEAVFTVNEEDGMTGAKNLDLSLIRSSLLLNLDGEEDTHLIVGCAGSIRSNAELSTKAAPAPAAYSWFDFTLSGLLGGHSGVDIDKGRANAVIVCASLIRDLGRDICLASLNGGTASNAIPREAHARVGIPAARAAGFPADVSRAAERLRAELGGENGGMQVACSPATAPAAALGADDAHGFLTVVAGVPNGLVAMEQGMEGVARTSSNLGKLDCRVEGKGADARFLASAVVMVRSSSDSEKGELAQAAETAWTSLRAAGWHADVQRPSVSPAWSPNLASPFLALAKKRYAACFGKEPVVATIHGGLECGIFAAKRPELDAISLGPDMRFPHSPDERVCISSVARTYRFVLDLLSSV